MVLIFNVSAKQNLLMVVLKDEQAVFKEEIQVALLSAIKVEVVYNQCEDFLCRQSKEVVFCFFEA